MSDVDAELVAWVAAMAVTAAKSLGGKIFDRVGDEVAGGTVTLGHRLADRLLRRAGGKQGRAGRAARQLEEGLRAAVESPQAADDPALVAGPIEVILRADPHLVAWLAALRTQTPALPGPAAGAEQPVALTAAFAAVESASRESMEQFARGLGLETRRLYVQGLAGTGKTVLGLTLAAMHARRARPGGLQALYLCLSEGLAMDLTARVSGLPGGGGIAIHTPESLYCEVVPEGADRLAWHRSRSRSLEDELAEALALVGGGEPGRTAASGSPVDEAQFWDELAQAASGHSPPVRFAAVVVDEAQDLPQHAFTALARLVESAGLFAVLADPRQITRLSRSGRPWPRPHELEAAPTRILEHNYRNTRMIAQDLCHRTGVEYLYPQIMPAGISPVVVRWRDEQSLRSGIERAAADLKDHGFDLAADAVLLVEDQSGSEILDRLIASGTCHHMPVVAVHDFKGRERLAVLYVRGPFSGLRAMAASIEQLYVGLSRAVVHAVLFEHEPESG